VRVSVVQAWPDRCERVDLQLGPDATVADALSGSGLALDGIAGYAVFGQRVEPTSPLRDGDRVELLRPLQADPKEARRRRAAGQRAPERRPVGKRP
jgi:uncharacterized protein